MRKRLILLATVGIAALVAAVAAWAGFPNFQRYSDPVLVYGASTSSPSGATRLASATDTATSSLGDPRVFIDNIVVVGIREGATTRLTAPFQAIYVCVNGGNNVPSAANKTTFSGTLETSAVFPAAKNGKAQGSLLTGPLPSAAEVSAATGFGCPSGQLLEFDRVIFSGLVLSIDGGEVVQLATTLVSQSVHGVG